MPTNETRRELLNRAKASGFPGSITEVFQAADQGIDLIEQHQMQQQQEQEMQVANTPQQQETGLREQHAMGNTQASMAFPDVQPNQSFNTVGMQAPIDIQKIDNQGHLVESYKNVPPGIQDLPTGPSEGTIIESPAAYQKGGIKMIDPNTGEGSSDAKVGRTTQFNIDYSKGKKKTDKTISQVQDIANFAPGLGEIIDAKNTIKSLSKGQYGNAALNAVGFAIPFIPGGAIKRGYKFLKNKIKSKPIIKSKPRSDINWGKWNKEIPGNTALIDEYKHIEEITKSRGTWMKNANGSTFKGSPEQFVQQKSKNFNKAFGKSVTRSASGEPQILMHKTDEVFDTFDPNEIGSRTDEGFWGKGFYFHTKENAKKYGDYYGKIEMPSYVNIEKPYIGKQVQNTGVNLSKEFDGRVVRSVTPKNPRPDQFIHPAEYLSTNPSNIKSAIGNRGTFDLTNPNIYKQKGGFKSKYQVGGLRNHMMDYLHNAGADTTYANNVMNAVGQHESNNVADKKQDSYKYIKLPPDVNGVVDSVKTRYDGPGRGAYQFEMGTKKGASTAFNRSAFFTRDSTSTSFSNFPSMYPEALQVSPDFSDLSRVDQDGLFLGDKMNRGKKAVKSFYDLIKKDGTPPTQEEVFKFWLKNHKQVLGETNVEDATEKQIEKERKKWNSRTKNLFKRGGYKAKHIL